ncbi:MAG: DMT family transporter [Gemmatimonadota bacterium]
MRPRSRVALATLASALYATCYSVIKAALPLTPPLRFAALRAAVAGVTVLIIVAAMKQPLLPPRRIWAGVVALGLVGTSVGFGAMFLSLQRSGAGLASVLGNTTPLLVIVLAALVLKERVTPSKAIALTLGFLGTALIALGASTGAGWSGLTGAAIPLTAAAAVATESVLVKKLDVGTAFLRVTAWQLLVGSIPLFVLSTWLETNAPTVWSPTFLGLLALVAVLGTAAATSIWYRLVQSDEVGRLSLYLFLIPVLGLALASILFRENLGGTEMMGIALALAGIAWAVRDSPRHPAPSVATLDE